MLVLVQPSGSSLHLLDSRHSCPLSTPARWVALAVASVVGTGRCFSPSLISTDACWVMCLRQNSTSNRSKPAEVLLLTTANSIGVCVCYLCGGDDGDSSDNLCLVGHLFQSSKDALWNLYVAVAQLWHLKAWHKLKTQLFVPPDLILVIKF